MQYYQNFISWTQEVGFAGFLDIIILAFLIYSVLVWFKRTKTASVLTGILIVVGIYLLIRQFDLVMTSMIFESFFAVFLIALIVIFQEELRSLFEKIALWSNIKRDVKRRKSLSNQSSDSGHIARVVGALAKDKIGALIVIKGRDSLERHIDGGIELEGKLSEPLLLSIFDASSAGHDGALMIDHGIVSKFACHLPLSRNLDEIGPHGTRHSAALGLAELCDALCIVVSEERGTISIAKDGSLKKLSGPEELLQILDEFHAYVRPPQKQRPWEDYLKKNSKEKFISILLALALWFVNVHSSKIVYKTFTIPVSHIELNKDWVLKELKPDTAQVTFHARRRAFYFFKKDDLNLLIKYRLLNGSQKIRLYAENLSFPKDFILDQIDPLYIDVNLTKSDIVKKEAIETGSRTLS